MQPILAGRTTRVLAVLLLLGLLSACFVWAGATPDDPLESEYPDETEVEPTREAYVGEQVSLGGVVVETDPLVIATRASGYGRFTLVDGEARLRNADGPLERGDRVTAFGTLEDESTLIVERAVTRDPGEARYMIVASLLGGLWVAGRFLRGWRFDRTTLAFEPRDRRAAESGDRRRAKPSAERTARAPTTDGDRRA